MVRQEIRAFQAWPWRKAHLGIDADTLEITAIEITAAGSAMSSRQAPPVRANRRGMLPELLHQIPADQPIGKVNADGAYDTRAYDTRACHAAIAGCSACAVIPARKNARPWLENTPGAQARNDTVRATRRLGRTIWRRWSGYHRRSLVETKCGASSYLANVSWRAISTDRSQSPRSGPQS